VLQGLCAQRSLVFFAGVSDGTAYPCYLEMARLFVRLATAFRAGFIVA